MLNENPAINKAVIDSITSLTNALYHPPIFSKVSKEELRDALSLGQIESKKWLLYHLLHISNDYKLDPLKIIVVGGWFGFLSASLNHLRGDWQADSLDILKDNFEIAQLVLDKLKGESILSDMYTFNYFKYNCVVNTSTEHIPDLQSWLNLIEPQTLVVLQNNNTSHLNGHINCAHSIEEFLKMTQLTKILFSGELKFSFYSRYMIIGII